MVQQELVPELTNGEFEKFVRSEGLVIVDFFAEWCMNCLMMDPIVEDLCERFSGKIKFAKINIEDNQALAQKLGVFSVPNLVLLRDGIVVDHFVGSTPAEELEEKLGKFLNQ